MADRFFSFKKAKPSLFTIELIDGKKLLVKMPKKRVFEQMSALDELDEKGASVDEQMLAISCVLAEILSNNMSGMQFSADDIDEMFDFEDKMNLFREYQEFMSSVTETNPN
ncbi:hypothetical protein LJC49_01140 [Ruminococcaceae bacterium OttesenSCG-928-I18]|nr:hypothetical protein [Ruminococcaceae bacterium OttesenSCG-928-I18]